MVMRGLSFLGYDSALEADEDKGQSGSSDGHMERKLIASISTLVDDDVPFLSDFVPAWQSRARCAQKDLVPEGANFFPEVGDHPKGAQLAKSVCALCPVKEECLRFSLSNPQEQGIFGGTSVRDRLILRRRSSIKCRSGLHDMTSDNIYMQGKYRTCRRCRLDRNAEYRERARVAS